MADIKPENKPAPLAAAQQQVQAPTEAYVPQEEAQNYSLPLVKLQREVNEKEVEEQSGVRKMILAERDRLEKEVQRLRLFEQKFHEVDRKYIALSSSDLSRSKLQAISALCLSVGGIVAGFATSAGELKLFFGLLLMGGLLLIIGYQAMKS